MEARIHIMPPPLANQIAAGEVVERPASAVKELIENALDAGARFIEVEIAGGGLKRILVTDDGEGIFPEDVSLAFRRHATSKVRRAEDLLSLATLGFRGEALPSIASVARVTLITRRRPSGEGDRAGVRMVVEGGKEVEVREAPAPPGTAVEVRDLFFNTPARMKFMKTPGTELARIVEATTSAALASPGVGFRLRNERRALLDLPPGDRESRVRALLPEREAEGLFALPPNGGPALREGGGPIRVEGFASLPSVSRAGRSCQHVVINGRYVRDRVVLNAAYEVYRGLIPSGRHPLLFLYLTAGPGEVDVNVHPAKAEVRFRDGGRVFAAVRRALAEGLIRASGAAGSPVADERAVGGGERAAQGPAKVYPLRRPADRPGDGRPGVAVNWAVSFSGRKRGHRSPALAAQALEREPAEDPLPLLQPAAPKALLSDVRVLGQLHETFILLEHPSGLLVVDQHTAHERVLFERLKGKADAGGVERQALLLPADVEVSPSEALLLQGRLGDLARLGLGVEPFGPSSFVVREVPALLAHVNPASLVRDALEGLFEAGRKEFSDLAGRVLDKMACRGAVKAGHRLRREEIERLVEECLELDLLFTCPHGRPIALVLPKEEVERRFLRR
ncbi:MAG: DNA mismatch repair endonuclease MutL [Candidatus Tectomicrobia bacterium]|nr:DNA mismatch repair endonuclease MutL [Candidatus Tectomicrobia bacterium]